MEKRNFTNSARNGGKTAEMRNNSAKSGVVGMSELQPGQLMTTDEKRRAQGGERVKV